MRRALTILMVASGLAAGAAQAQVVLSFGQLGDSAVAAFPGALTTVDVQVSDLPYNFSGCYSSPYGIYNAYCLTYATVTIGFDPAKVDSIAVEPVSSGLAAVSGSTPGAGLFTVVASGAVGGYQVTAFRLRVRLAAGVTDGAYLWMHADSLTSAGWSLTTGAKAQIGTLCHASHIYGDVDGNGQVDSRDALITLSAAVGLTVSGTFNLAYGDVDGDGLANSRDALMMLSYAIGITPGSSGPLNRVAAGISDACPGLSSPGETVVFNRNVGGSGGIFRLDAGSTSPVQITSVLTDQWPRLNAAGTSVVFQCDSLGDPLVCRTGADGSSRTTLLTSNPPYANPTFGTQPDWSPSGAYILYDTRGGFGVGRMTANGDSAVAVYSSGMFGAAVAWSRNDSIYVLTNPNHYGLYAIRIDNALPSPLDANFGDIQYAAPIRWSPDGSTIAAVNYNGGGILTLPRTGGVNSVPAAAPNGITAFDWGPQGVIFSMPDAHGTMSLWLLQGGFGGPVVRLTNPGYGSGQADDQPSFRRNP
jgi:hypothetical protein